MEIKKKLEISEVVVDSKSIRELANKIAQEYQKDFDSMSESEKQYCLHLDFILKSSDETQYSSNDLSFFEKNGIIDSRRIIGIEMDYRNSHLNKSINVRVYHSLKQNEWNNIIMVKGGDETWTNGILSSLRDIISNWKKQKNWFNKYYYFLLIGFGLGISLFLYNAIQFVSSLLLKNIDLCKNAHH